MISADRKSMRYRSQRGDDAELGQRLCDLAQQRRRFGYRRLHILLRRDGLTINRKKTQRLYREEGLTVITPSARTPRSATPHRRHSPQVSLSKGLLRSA